MVLGEENLHKVVGALRFNLGPHCPSEAILEERVERTEEEGGLQLHSHQLSSEKYMGSVSKTHLKEVGSKAKMVHIIAKFSGGQGGVLGGGAHLWAQRTLEYVRIIAMFSPPESPIKAR